MGGMPPPLLTAKNISRTSTRDGRPLLQSVNLQLEENECVALIGPAGSGKTLLLRALAWLDPIDEGQVLLQRQSPREIGVPKYRRQVIYMHQSVWLPEGTVEQALAQPWKMSVARSSTRDSSSDEDIVEQLRQVGRSEAFLNKNTADLSGGERQIAALLRAIQLKPKVLLMDEPMSALDGETSGRAETLLQSYLEADRRRAAILVTHDLDQARRMCSRQLQIRDGKLE